MGNILRGYKNFRGFLLRCERNTEKKHFINSLTHLGPPKNAVDTLKTGGEGNGKNECEEGVFRGNFTAGFHPMPFDFSIRFEFADFIERSGEN
jgi:hypothetical protein